MFVASPPRPTYRCPGEAYDIPHGVHLARLAAGYDRCRECRYRHEPSAAESSTSTADDSSLDRSVAPPTHAKLFQQNGVRGVYLNEITRYEAGRIAGAFASCLWDELGTAAGSLEQSNPSAIRSSAGIPESIEGVTLLPAARPGLTVVLAHDERPAGPDLVMGVGVALRRMGCQVIDVGPVTRPCFWFAVDHLRAAGGIHVTGSGTDPSGIGLDFVSHGGRPCSRGGMLDQIELRWRQGYGRATRRPGTQRLFNPTVPYEAGLLKHFHALRPLRIALGCPSRPLRELLQRLFHQVACRLIPVETPTRARQMFNPRDPDVARVIQAVRDSSADLGILIDDDAQTCTVIDDDASITAPSSLLGLLCEMEREHHAEGDIVDLDRGLPAGPAEGPSLEHQHQLASRVKTLCIGTRGRYWFRDTQPTCDAVLTLVRLLQRLSRSDVPLSQL